MLKMRKGCKAPFPEKLFEGYMLNGDYIIANVSADKISDVMAHFICMHDEKQFFILELPSKQDDETEVKPGTVGKFHKDVYYIDGCSVEEALAVLVRAGNILINDGLCSFGFGCHDSYDEIMFGKYNVTTVYSRQIEKYKEFFAEHDIPHTDRLVTAPETFSRENPGYCELTKTDGKDVYSLLETFAEWGIYKAEQREE